MEYVRPEYLPPMRDMPAPMAESSDALSATPNATPLDWSDPNPEIEPETWAVSFRVGNLQQAAEAFERLEDELGSVEDRFIHLRADGQASVTMFVRREETEGKALPDISSFAEVRRLRAALVERGSYAANFSEQAREFWRPKPMSDEKVAELIDWLAARRAAKREASLA